MRLVSFRTGDEVQVGSLEDDRVRVLAAPTMVDWLAGEGRLETRVEHGLERRRAASPPFPSRRRCATSSPSRSTSRPA